MATGPGKEPGTTGPGKGSQRAVGVATAREAKEGPRGLRVLAQTRSKGGLRPLVHGVRPASSWTRRNILVDAITNTPRLNTPPRPRARASEQVPAGRPPEQVLGRSTLNMLTWFAGCAPRSSGTKRRTPTAGSVRRSRQRRPVLKRRVSRLTLPARTGYLCSRSPTTRASRNQRKS
mgnify:CR=1 FL=1